MINEINRKRLPLKKKSVNWSREKYYKSKPEYYKSLYLHHHLSLFVFILIINFNICTMKRKVLLSTLFLILHFTVALAQQVTISGQVLDEKSEPLIGATINIEGTTNAVITDLEGKFTIKVLPSEKLVISYLGYKPKTITIGKNRRFDIILDPSVTEMDEVVVVGYGSQRKSDIATAVASVNIKDIVNSLSLIHI